MADVEIRTAVERTDEVRTTVTVPPSKEYAVFVVCLCAVAVRAFSMEPRMDERGVPTYENQVSWMKPMMLTCVTTDHEIMQYVGVLSRAIRVS